MKLRRVNIILGVSQIFFSLVLIVKLILDIQGDTSGFGAIGYLFIAPLLLLGLVGVIGLVNYQKKFRGSKVFLIIGQVFIALGVVSEFTNSNHSILSILFAVLCALPLAMGVIKKITIKNIGYHILFFQVYVICIELYAISR